MKNEQRTNLECSPRCANRHFEVHVFWSRISFVIAHPDTPLSSSPPVKIAYQDGVYEVNLDLVCRHSFRHFRFRLLGLERHPTNHLWPRWEPSFWRNFIVDRVWSQNKINPNHTRTRTHPDTPLSLSATPQTRMSLPPTRIRMSATLEWFRCRSGTKTASTKTIFIYWFALSKRRRTGIATRRSRFVGARKFRFTLAVKHRCIQTAEWEG